MKLYFSLVVLSLVFNHSVYLSSVNNFQPQGHWQCDEPEQKSLDAVVSGYTQSVFHAIGYSKWMLCNRTYISCYQRGLRGVPKGLDKNVEILDFRQNSITHIKNNDFSQYAALVAILLQQNCLSANIYRLNVPSCSSVSIKIDDEAFVGLTNLTHLELSYNKITKIPTNLPQSLKVLGIEMAELGRLNTTVTKNLKGLQIAMLGRNCIEESKFSLCKNQFSLENFNFSSANLSYLDLRFNNLKRVPYWLFSKNLVGINLQGNPIHIVRSDDFSACPLIRYLFFSWTSKFDKIPMLIQNGAFKGLTDLDHIDLTGNMLSALPDFSSNTKLSNIGFDYNCLKMSAKNPTNLSSLTLTKLEMFGNTFCNNFSYPIPSRIPAFKLGDSFRNLTALESLKFEGYTSLTTPTVQELYWILSYGYHYDYVDEDGLQVLYSLPKLRSLSLTFSGIRCIDMAVFCKFNLSILDLGINEIKQLSVNKALCIRSKREVEAMQQASSSANLKDFAYLYEQYKQGIKNQYSNNILILHRNALTDLPKDAFKCFSTTSFLDLSYNQISYIPSDTFAYMTQLETLNIQFNPLRHIQPSSRNGLARLSTLNLNYSIPQGEFTLKFLLNTSNFITLNYGDITDNIFRLLSVYRQNSTKFHSVVSITFSNIPLVIYDVLNNEPIFEPFPSLQQISLISAQISTSLGNMFFGGVSNVTNITLRACLLRQFPYEALGSLSKLRHLDLSDNFIESLNKSWFKLIANLTLLTLSHNFIKFIEPETLSYLVEGGLLYLDLSYNLISDITSPVIDHKTLSKLMFLDIRKNPIVCDCSLSRNFGIYIQSRANRTPHAHIAGLLPDCPSAVDTFYGGCLACNLATGSLLQPPSLFLYSLSNICEVRFLIKLTSSFTISFFIFILFSLLCNNTSLQNRLILAWLKTRGQSNEETEDIASLSTSRYVHNAVVIYDKEDATIGDWVDFVMIPKLSTGSPPLNIAVVGKEDWCGISPAVHQLLVRMGASYKSVVLLTDEFEKSLLCKYVLRVLEQWFYTQGEDRCIIVTFKNHPPIRRGFQMRRRRNQMSVLNLPDPKKEDNTFMELLRCAITTKPYHI